MKDNNIIYLTLTKKEVTSVTMALSCIAGDMEDAANKATTENERNTYLIASARYVAVLNKIIDQYNEQEETIE